MSETAVVGRTTPEVHETAVPPACLAVRALVRIDHGDAYRVLLPEGCAPSAREAAEAMFGAPPTWLRSLLGLRDRLVRPFGLRPARGGENDGRWSDAGGWGVMHLQAETPNEMLLGDDDRHLDFRVSLFVERGANARHSLVVATVVRFHNPLGRLYFLPVLPFHRRIVPAMMRTAVARLCRAQKA